MDKQLIKTAYRAECTSTMAMKRALRERAPRLNEVSQSAWDRFCDLMEVCSIQERVAVTELIRTRGNGS